MSEEVLDNRRIAKNTLILYIRMFISMTVGLYTSRVVLNTLGVEDFGIYGVVGGVVGMLGFLNASMSGATSRFIIFELGTGDMQKLRDTFSSSLIIHIAIALIVLLFAETVGLWFLCNKLVIPDNRMEAAYWVYQLSIFSAMLSITQTPYNACIIAHEKMSVYAYIEILSIVLKLMIVYLLLIGNWDKLKLYSLLVFLVSMLIMMVYRIYCIRHFVETHFHWVWDKSVLKPLFSFSGWDLYGNVCVTVKGQSILYLVNIFFGVTLNAASSIANTVSGTIRGFSTNMITAFRPQIIKSYSARKIDKMQELIEDALKYTSILLIFLSVPFFLEMYYILYLWLGIVPGHTVTFCRIFLISNMVGLLNSIITIGIHAEGNIKEISFITGTLHIFIPVFSYVSLIYISDNVNTIYIIDLLAFVIIVGINMIVLKKKIPRLGIMRIFRGILLSYLVGGIAALPVICLHFSMCEGWRRLIMIFGIYFLVLSFLDYFFVLNQNDRALLRGKIKAIVCKK